MKTTEDQKNEAILKLILKKPLTERQISEVFFNISQLRTDGSTMTADELMVAFARAIEKAHGIE